MEMVKRVNIVLLLIIVLIVTRFLLFIYLDGKLPMPVRDQALYLHVASRIASGNGLSIGEDLIYLKFLMSGDSVLGKSWQDDPLYAFGIARLERPTATIEPGYPFLLGIVFMVTGKVVGAVFLLNLAASFIGAFCIYTLIKERWGERSAIAGSLFWVLYPYFVYYNAYAMSDSLHISLLAIVIYITHKTEKKEIRWAFFAGMATGFLFLVRSTVIFIPVLQIIYMIKTNHSGIFKRILVLSAGFLLLIAPWVIRNQIEMGEAVLFPTKGALNLWMRNNPEVLEDEGINIPDEMVESINRTDLLEFPEFSDSQNEIERSRILQDRAFSFIRANPVFFLRLSIQRLIGFISPVGGTIRSGLSFLTGFFLYLPVLFLAFWQLIRKRRDSFAIFLGLLFICYALLHAFAHGGVRYRLPVDTCLIILASSVFCSGKRGKIKG